MANREEVIEYLKGMTLLEASELVKELETVFGVSAAAAAVARLRRRRRRSGSGGGREDRFDVILQAAAATR